MGSFEHGPERSFTFLQDTPSLQDLKLMYYNLLIRYHEHQNSYIDICRCYRSIYEVDMAAHIRLPEQTLLLLLKPKLCSWHS